MFIIWGKTNFLPQDDDKLLIKPAYQEQSHLDKPPV